MPYNVLVSSAAYSLTDNYAASEGLAAFHIMKGLGKHDVHFHAVATNVMIERMPPNLRVKEVRVPPDPVLLDNKILTLVSGTYYLVRNFQKSVSIMRREDVDLVHHMFPSNNANFSLLPLLSDVRSRCPFIFGPVCGPNPLTTPYHRLFAKLHDANCRRADAVVVQTKQLKDMYSEKFGESKVHLIPLGVEADFFESYEAVASDAFEILVVANLWPGKGLRYLIEAMPDIIKETKNAHLTIVGEGPERGALEAQIDQLGLKKRVDLAGFVPHDQVRQYYRRAQLFCLPSLADVFGKVIVEAMACGKPVVITDIPGPSSLIDHGRNGILVPPRSSRSLAEAINAMASDDQLRATLSLNARKSADQYSWDVIVEKYWNVYRAFLEK
jgi:glycosyltransferase involved in cell wall biosynthesis